jgi:hypothetical protein
MEAVLFKAMDTRSGGSKTSRLTGRLLCAMAVLAVYPASYAVARLGGNLVHFHYGLCPDPARGREHHVVYHAIRHRSFAREHPVLGHVPRRSLLEDVFWPLSQVELTVRRLPASEQAR